MAELYRRAVIRLIVLLYLESLSEKSRRLAAVLTRHSVRDISDERLSLTMTADQRRWSVQVWHRSSRQDSAVLVTWHQ